MATVFRVAIVPAATPAAVRAAGIRGAGNRAAGMRPAAVAAGLVAMLLATGGCSRAPGGDAVVGDEPLEPAAIVGTEITEEAAQKLFPALRVPDSRVRWDPLAYVALLPDRDNSFEWPEHPAGRIRFRTNNLGFREDQPTTIEHDTWRILVTGDSHTEGAVDNDESFASALERLLAQGGQGGQGGPGGRAFEVINAAVGSTGPDNYLGMLRKQLPLRLQMCIAVLYTGNDFANTLMIADFRSKRQAPPRGPDYVPRFRDARARWPEIFPQSFNQAFYFRHRPDDVALALDATLAVLQEMAALCRESGILFLVVVLPTKPDVDDDDPDTCRELMSALALSDEDCAVNRRLGERCAAALRERGIPCVDALSGLGSRNQPLYWRRDHHLNIAGHAVLAQIVAPAVRELIRTGNVGVPEADAAAGSNADVVSEPPR